MNSDLIDMQYAIDRLPMWCSRTVVDCGAQNGETVRLFVSKGFDVLALEPNLEKREALIAIGSRVLVYSVAASDNENQAMMYLFTNDGMNSLEVDWTRSVFPEAYKQDQRQVGCRTLHSLFSELDIRDVAILKLDVEGHEEQAMVGLFAGPIRPDVIVFEVNERTPTRARACISMLNDCGYGNFAAFLKHGNELLSFSKWDRCTLPPGWDSCVGSDFYGNVIASLKR